MVLFCVSCVFAAVGVIEGVALSVKSFDVPAVIFAQCLLRFGFGRARARTQNVHCWDGGLCVEYLLYNGRCVLKEDNSSQDVFFCKWHEGNGQVLCAFYGARGGGRYFVHRSLVRGTEGWQVAWGFERVWRIWIWSWRCIAQKIYAIFWSNVNSTLPYARYGHLYLDSSGSCTAAHKWFGWEHPFLASLAELGGRASWVALWGTNRN